MVSLSEESDVDNDYFWNQIKALELEKYTHETYNLFDDSYWLPEIFSGGFPILGGYGVTWNYSSMKYVKLRNGMGPTEGYKAYLLRSHRRYDLFLVGRPHSNVLASMNSQTSVSGI